MISDVPSPQSDALADLVQLRRSIDNIDNALICMLAERFRCTQKVGELKAHRGLPASDPLREERQVSRLRALAEESGLDPNFSEHFFSFIVREVIKNHEKIAHDKK